MNPSALPLTDDYDATVPCYQCGKLDPGGNWQRRTCEHYACEQHFLDGPDECPCVYEGNGETTDA